VQLPSARASEAQFMGRDRIDQASVVRGDDYDRTVGRRRCNSPDCPRVGPHVQPSCWLVKQPQRRSVHSRREERDLLPATGWQIVRMRLRCVSEPGLGKFCSNGRGGTSADDRAGNMFVNRCRRSNQQRSLRQPRCRSETAVGKVT
jgi:hypothetical protein